MAVRNCAETSYRFMAECHVIDATIRYVDAEDRPRAFTEKQVKYDDLRENLYKWHPGPLGSGVRLAFGTLRTP
jgi:hypothetical protein